MTGKIEIEWLFDDCEQLLEKNQIASCNELGVMTLAEELVEITAPLCHPIGAISIQIVGVSAVYDWLARVEHSKAPETQETEGELYLSLVMIFLVIFTSLCIKFKLPKFVVWLPLLLLSIAAWLILEWSLFL